MGVDFDNPGDTIMRPATLAHVFLRTNKFTEMVAFYKKFLNADARFESSRISFLCFDEEHHRIAIAAMPGTGDKVQTSAGLEHIAFTFNTLEDLALAYRQRKKQGMEPTWCVNHGITISIYYEDPDGNRLETQVDCFDNVDEATDFMSTKEFQQNPIGSDFDPEDLVRRLQSGEDHASIKKRIEVGSRGVPSHLVEV
jgi:catechol-2,3-dioxygenase